MIGRDIRFMPFECTAGDGLALRGVFHGVERDNAPCVLFCHGFTGHRLGPGYLFVKCSRALADAGISSVRFDFRGSGESEGVFNEMNTVTMMEDLATVTAVVRERFAPGKTVLCGHSFGGMIAARKAAALQADGLILLAPVSDPQGIVRRRRDLLEAGPNATGYYENGPHEMSLTFLDCLRGFDPAAELAASYAGRLLLLQGDSDPSISVDESYRYIRSAEQASIPCTYHVLSGADHNFSRVADVRTVVTTIVSWTKELSGE